MNEDEMLKLDNQLCFALYSASRKVIRRYKPILDKLGITYTQYIALLVLWEEDCLTLNQLGKRLELDSGTLTPLLKKMEKAQLITRQRATKDERKICIALTEKGRALKEEAKKVPQQIVCLLSISIDEAISLKESLKKVFCS